MTGEQSPSEWEPSLGAQLTERIRYWNVVFRQADPEQYDSLNSQAVKELDELWMSQGLLGEECIVSGWGIWSELVTDSEDDEEETSDFDGGDTLIHETQNMPHAQMKQGDFNAKQGISHGFTVCMLVDDAAPSIWCKFELPSLRISHNQTLVEYVEPYLLAKPESMVVVALAEFEEPFEKPVDEYTASIAANGLQSELLSKYSWDLVKMVRSTPFRRLKRKDQARLVDMLIEEAETATGIMDADVLLEPDYGYVPELSHGRVVYRKIDLRGICINGVCLGLSMPGRELLECKAIRRDGDLFSKSDGLALSIALENGQEDASERVEAGLNMGNIVHVPISGQTFYGVVEPHERIAEIVRSMQEDEVL